MRLHVPYLGPAELRRCARTLLGCLLSYSAARLASLPELYWAVITTLVVVTQPSLNQALSAGRDQIIGAGIGAVVGVAGIVAMLHGAPPLAVFAIALVPLAALTAYRPSLRLACVTLVIVVLIPSTGGPAFERPIDRVLEILIGAGAAFVVSFLLPNRAVRIAHTRAAELLGLLRELLELYLTHPADTARGEPLNRRATDLEQTLADAMIEAGREHIIVPVRRTKGDVIDRMIPLLRRLHRDTLFLGQALTHSPSLAEHLRERLRWDDVLTTYETIAAAMTANTLDETAMEGAARALHDFGAQIAALPGSADQSAVLPFVLKLIVQDLDEMLVTLQPERAAAEKLVA